MRRAALLTVVALGLAGCGGGTQTVTVATTTKLPPIPRATAERLAGEADAVSRALAGGDSCGARDAAAQLRRDTIAAINAHEVPGAYQEELLGRAQALEAQITCVPPATTTAPAPAPVPPGHAKHPKKHEHPHHEKKKKHGD